MKKFAFIALALITACATTTNVAEKQCGEKNWSDLGKEIGSKGQPVTSYNFSTCDKAGNTQAQVSFKKGWKKGMRQHLNTEIANVSAQIKTKKGEMKGSRTPASKTQAGDELKKLETKKQQYEAELKAL